MQKLHISFHIWDGQDGTGLDRANFICNLIIAKTAVSNR